MSLLVCILFAYILQSEATVYVEEKFIDGDGWKSRWVQSKHKSDYGEFVLSEGKFYGNAEAAKGIKTSQDARFYELSRKLDKVFDNTGKPLVLQFSVKHEQNIDCGGGYVKLLPANTDLNDFNGETPYYIMFGPDICGYSTKLVQVIFNYKGKNLQVKREIPCESDELTHVYTLIVKPDLTYEVLIDNKSVQSGNLEDDWEFLQPKKISDPKAKKPEDWDDREMIDDETDKKPDDWEKPETIPDPDAKKPDDWDDEMDGEWEPPVISNPEYKGEWKPKQIKNPKYKGLWKAPEIPNPDYVPDSNLYIYKDIGAVGFDLWQVKSGTIFDNILLTDDPEYAKKLAESTWGAEKDIEKKKKDEHDEAERKKMEEEAKNKEPEKKEEEKTDDEEEEEPEEPHAHAGDEL
ncbi:calreticulin [Trichuris trichiura]|uniref:Calreticulin n=1 Tax=Trichuris trichiura TaxID=36087 RepID=A0A077ZC09_TRITR|nr:calreticulin [Trichuris trichiura]